MLSLLIYTLLLLPTSLAIAIEPRQGQEFYLKTSVVGGSGYGGNNKGGLYVTAYHTGAGLSDATLESDLSEAAKGFLNGTNLQFDLNTNFPWGFNLGGEANYAGWELVEINAGEGTGGFSFNSSGLQWNATGFGGWLACDWWHGVPQLFWLDSFYQDAIPCSCSQVDLVQQDV